MEKYTHEMTKLHDTIKESFRYTSFSINITKKLTKIDYDISKQTKVCIDLFKENNPLTKKRFKAWITGKPSLNKLIY